MFLRTFYAPLHPFAFSFSALKGQRFGPTRGPQDSSLYTRTATKLDLRLESGQRAVPDPSEKSGAPFSASRGGFLEDMMGGRRPEVTGSGA